MLGLHMGPVKPGMDMRGDRMNLVERAKEKDSEAFEILMRNELPSMYRIAASILQNDEDVADAVQETLLICWEKIGTLKNDTFFKTWLIRILINQSNDILRKRKHTVPLDEVGELFVTDSYDNNEWKEITGLLDEKYRTVIELFYVEELSTREISKVMDISEANVRIRLSRGRKQLEKAILMQEKVFRRA